MVAVLRPLPRSGREPSLRHVADLDADTVASGTARDGTGTFARADVSESRCVTCRDARLLATR